MNRLLPILACIIMLACGSSRPDAEALLLLAEKNVALGDTIAARQACMALSDSTTFQLTPSQLCRQAIAYAKLREICDNPDDMASAAKCYAKALAISQDSVLAFFNDISVSDLATLRMIRYVNQAAESPCDITLPDDE